MRTGSHGIHQATSERATEEETFERVAWALFYLEWASLRSTLDPVSSASGEVSHLSVS
jgi:hypothetical protein